jgi:hypothetical protein
MPFDKPFFLNGTGVWTQASHLLGRHSTTWVTTPALFCFSYFLARVSYSCPGPAWDFSPPTYASHVAEITAVSHHACLLGWDGGHADFLPGLTLNCDLISTSWVFWTYRCEPLSPVSITHCWVYLTDKIMSLQLSLFGQLACSESISLKMALI